MSDNIQNIDAPTPPSSTPLQSNLKLPLSPYVFDFIKYIGGFTVIIIIALILIHTVAKWT
ncbi:MAG TPA: hypothetical protein ENI56_01265 [Candidatus Kaiserbacteria bacterium]|nr:hypothetical protein [Candidatus Kaiserbacteria bacterium]